MHYKILKDKPSLPSWMSSDAHSLIRGLLEKDPSRRLGARASTMFEVGGVATLKRHPFFKDIDWEQLALKQVPAPIPVTLDGELDTSNFDKEFTSLGIKAVLAEDAGAFTGCWYTHGMLAPPLDTGAPTG